MLVVSFVRVVTAAIARSLLCCRYDVDAHAMGLKSMMSSACNWWHQRGRWAVRGWGLALVDGLRALCMEWHGKLMKPRLLCGHAHCCAASTSDAPPSCRLAEWRRDVRWAMYNKRVRIATEMFSELFGPDFDSIIPIYPTGAGWVGCAD